MPSLAKRSCSTPGCRHAAANGARCIHCERKQKGTAAARGYDADHRRLRILAFQRDNWRCVDCGWRPQIIVDCERVGIDDPPLEEILNDLRRAYHRGERHLHGDHILPIEERPEQRLNLDNYATRCNVCHDVRHDVRARAGGTTKGRPVYPEMG
jgi:HNH endonuclease